MITADILTNGSLYHPVFNPNQVLTNRHLNDTVTFLEGQTRLTRVNFFGTGILCGFIPTLETVEVGNGDGTMSQRLQLVISEGCGLTTEGYLISEGKMELQYYGQPVFLPKTFPNYEQVKDDFRHPVFELFSEQESQQQPVIERVTGNIRPFGEPLLTSSTNGTAVELLTPLSDRIETWIPILFIELRDKFLDPCENDCDEAGGRRYFNLRKLLIHKDDARLLIRQGFEAEQNETLEDILHRKFEHRDLSIRRFGFKLNGAITGEDPSSQATINLCSITSEKEYLSSYARVSDFPGDGLSSVIDEITSAYQQAHEIFSPIFSRSFQDLAESDFAELADRLRSHLDQLKYQEPDLSATGEPQFAEQPVGIQYFYDYLKDLIAAYEEFCEVAFDLMEDCLPPVGRFPRHLALGEINPTADCKPSVFRYHFAQPAVYNGNERRVKEARMLYRRMQRLTEEGAFQIPAITDRPDIRITPGQGPDTMLSQRPIPYYYLPERNLHEIWNYELSRKCKPYHNHSYHPIPIPEGGVGLVPPNPLLHNIDARPFYRIEGHLGQDYADVLSILSGKRKNYNLPFDLVALKIGQVPDEENEQFDLVFEDLETLFQTLKEDLICILEPAINAENPRRRRPGRRSVRLPPASWFRADPHPRGFFRPVHRV